MSRDCTHPLIPFHEEWKEMNRRSAQAMPVGDTSKGKAEGASNPMSIRDPLAESREQA